MLDPRTLPERKCRGVPPSVFFPPEESGYDYSTARQMCDACPVREPCAEWAIERCEDHGMWGGLTPRERKRERRYRSLVALGVIQPGA